MNYSGDVIRQIVYFFYLSFKLVVMLVTKSLRHDQNFWNDPSNQAIGTF